MCMNMQYNVFKCAVWHMVTGRRSRSGERQAVGITNRIVTNTSPIDMNHLKSQLRSFFFFLQSDVPHENACENL